MHYYNNEKIKKIIAEVVSDDEVETNIDVEPVENVWSGDLEAEDKNLVEPIDHSDAAGSEPATQNPESLDDAEPILAGESFGLKVYCTTNGLGRSYTLPKSLSEDYYNAYVAGNSRAARMLIEFHLNRKFPNWIDYEWTTIKG